MGIGPDTKDDVDGNIVTMARRNYPTYLVNRALQNSQRRSPVVNPVIPPPQITGQPFEDNLAYPPEVLNASVQWPVREEPSLLAAPKSEEADLIYGSAPTAAQDHSAIGTEIAQNDPAISTAIEQRQVAPPIQPQQPLAANDWAGANSLLEEKLSQQLLERQQIADRLVENDESKLNDLYQGAKLGFARAGKTGDLGMALGGTIVGAVKGFFQPKEYEQFKKDRDLMRADAGIAQTQAAMKEQADMSFRQAQAQKIANDDVRATGKFQMETEAHERENFKLLAGSKKYDPQNPIDRRLAEMNGMNPDSIPAFDDRNLVERFLEDGTPVLVSGDKALEAEIARDYRQAQLGLETGRVNAKTWNDYNAELDKWIKDDNERSVKVATMKNDGDAKLAQSRQLYLQAEALDKQADVEEQNDTERANKLRDEAVKLRNESTKVGTEGQALLKNAQNMPGRPRPKPPQTITAPTLAPIGQPRPPDKSVLETRLKERGFKPGSPEWKKVMAAANYQ